MDSPVSFCNWQEIHGFKSNSEYHRFENYIEQKIKDGSVREVGVDVRYEKGMIYGGRWFMDISSGQVWRLISPDFPFKGLWEPVRIG